MNFGDLLLRLIEARGFTQRGYSQAIGVDCGNLNKPEWKGLGIHNWKNWRVGAFLWRSVLLGWFEVRIWLKDSNTEDKKDK